MFHKSALAARHALHKGDHHTANAASAQLFHVKLCLDVSRETISHFLPNPRQLSITRGSSSS
jgi:hypothetical protein